MIRIVLLLVATAACSPDAEGPGPDGATPPDGAPGVDSGRPPEDAGGADDAGDGGSDADAAVMASARGILSLNLHCLETEGTAFRTNDERFRAIAEQVVTAEARVLLLQEACDDGSTDALAALEVALESATGRSWYGSFSFAHIAWEGTARQADEGVAILADVPLTAAEAFEHGAMGSLRRVMLSATLGGDLRGLRVGTFHLDHADAALREVQAQELATAGLLHARGAEVVLGGDLNAREGSPAYEAMVQAGYVDATAALRRTRIDHVFVHRGASFGATSARLVFEDAANRVSDHPGVLVHVGPRAPAPLEFTTFAIDVGPDLGVGDRLFLRGDRAPLSWDRGWPLVEDGPGTWRFAATELAGTFAYKVLRNDLDWSAGDNYAGAAGVVNRATVSAFE